MTDNQHTIEGTETDFDFSQPGEVERMREYIKTTGYDTLTELYCLFMIEALRRIEAPEMSCIEYREQFLAALDTDNVS